MDGVSPIGGMPSGGMPYRTNPAGNAEGAPAAPIQHNLAGTEASSSKTIASLSASSINASSESLIASNGPVLADEQLLGLVVLLLTLQYLQSDDEEEKKDLLTLLLALAQQQQSGNSSESLMYNSTSLSVESSQMQVISTDNALSAYSGGTIDPQQTPPADPGAAGLDVSA